RAAASVSAQVVRCYHGRHAIVSNPVCVGDCGRSSVPVPAAWLSRGEVRRTRERDPRQILSVDWSWSGDSGRAVLCYEVFIEAQTGAGGNLKAGGNLEGRDERQRDLSFINQAEGSR